MVTMIITNSRNKGGEEGGEEKERKNRERKPRFTNKKNTGALKKSTEYQIDQNDIMKIGNTEQDISVFSEPLLNVNQEMQTQANIKLDFTKSMGVLLWINFLSQFLIS